MPNINKTGKAKKRGKLLQARGSSTSVRSRKGVVAYYCVRFLVAYFKRTLRLKGGPHLVRLEIGKNQLNLCSVK